MRVSPGAGRGIPGRILRGAGGVDEVSRRIEGERMAGWTKTGDGWAVNLDGSDAGSGFSLPRVELRSTGRGWTCVCRLANGMALERPGPLSGSVPETKRAAVAQARTALGGLWKAALDALAPADPA